MSKTSKKIKKFTDKNCGDCSRVIHKVTAESVFAYTYRYIPEANSNILYPLYSVAVTVEGPFNSQGVVMRVEKIRDIVQRYVIKPWNFSILVFKDQLPVPRDLVIESNSDVVVVDFVPSVEGTANFIYNLIKNKIESYGVKLVKVDVMATFDGHFIGTAERKD